MPLITTPGSALADSYASLAEAAACIAMNPYASGWATVATADQENFLRMATSLLDGMPAAWTGNPTTPAVQALRWPRIGMRNRNEYPIATNVIPQELKCATAEYARLLAENDLTTTPGSSEALGVSSVSAGGVSMSIGSSSASAGGVTAGSAPGVGPLSNNWGKNAILHAQVPSSVIMKLVPSWLKDPRDVDGPYTGLVVETL